MEKIQNSYETVLVISLKLGDEGVAAMVQKFKDLIEAEGVTIVMTTHDAGLMEIGDRVYEIEDGEIVHADHA